MLIFSYIEAVLPINLGSIGVKIGLSNIMTIIGIKILGIRTTLLINILRLIIIGILFGNVVRFAISVAGFCLSFIVMAFLIKRLNFSIITTSIFGGISHNIGQLIAVAIITKGVMVFVLVPIYIIVGLLTGFIIGIITKLIYDKIQLIMFD
ncbi:MAG: Gx transporter family protein [Lachnospiraceae bacterium]|nr:Gx transporter family protein [Lachnospiraceae bacterium]